MLRSVTVNGQCGNRNQSLKMPQLPDPANTDNQFVQKEKLDFTISLGSTLARSNKTEEKHTNRVVISAPNNLSATKSAPEKTRAGNRTNMARQNSRRGSMVVRNKTSSVDIETALMKVQRIFRTVKIISGVCLALKRYVKECETKTWSFMEMYLHVKEDLNQLVAFNPHSFAKVEPERVKLKILLHIKPHDRTTENIKVILALLRDNQSFQDYPSHVQVELARCMTYQSYEARRVVLKQGHRAEAFYIVLSGVVMANVEDISPSNGNTFVKTVQEMVPGDTFGELALIEGGRRKSTIVCKTTVELLVILKDDFDNIIRTPLVKQIDEHVAFCKSIPLFQDFPCDELAENPSQFFYHFFRKGEIVIKDSKESKYIIAVKAGKCRVIARYAESSKPKRKYDTLKSRKDMTAAFPQYQDIKNLQRTSKTDAERLKETICLGLLTGQIDKIRLADHGPDVHRPKTSMTSADLEKKIRPPPFEKSKSLSEFFSAVAERRQEDIKSDEDLDALVNSGFWATRLKHTRKSNMKRGHNRSVSAKSTSSSRPPSRNPFYTKEKNTYAQIAEFGTGTIFGLESLAQKPSTCLSLVSEGAECIFISKRLFLSLANIKVLRAVTDMIQTYPSKELIEEQVRNCRIWKQYKSGLINSVLNRRR